MENLTDDVYNMSKFEMGYWDTLQNDEIWLLLLLIGLWVYGNNITEELIDRDPHNGLESSFTKLYL